MTNRILQGAALLLTGVAALALVAPGAALQDAGSDQTAPRRKDAMEVRYLEIVTPDLDATCAALEAAHGVTFGDPVPELGNARTASLAGGNRIGVRKPLRPDEEPVVRPYVLAEDIEAAVAAAKEAGAEIAIPPMEIPGQGTFAIYLLGGNEYGLWKD